MDMEQWRVSGYRKSNPATLAPQDITTCEQSTPPKLESKLQLQLFELDPNLGHLESLVGRMSTPEGSLLPFGLAFGYYVYQVLLRGTNQETQAALFAIVYTAMLGHI